MKTSMFAWLSVLAAATGARADETPTAPTPLEPPVKFDLEQYYYGGFIALLVFGFGLAALLVAVRAVSKSSTASAEDFARPIVLVTIVTASVFLVSSAQANPTVLAAAFGLFGSVVGYMFGRTSNAPRQKDEPPALSPAKPEDKPT